MIGTKNVAPEIKSCDYHDANGQRQQAADTRRFGWENWRSRVARTRTNIGHGTRGLSEKISCR